MNKDRLDIIIEAHAYAWLHGLATSRHRVIAQNLTAEFAPNTVCWVHTGCGDCPGCTMKDSSTLARLANGFDRDVFDMLDAL